jgi:hypothetical protein
MLRLRDKHIRHEICCSLSLYSYYVNMSHFDKFLAMHAQEIRTFRAMCPLLLPDFNPDYSVCTYKSW